MTNMETRPGGALVLFSGGQDSTTCLAWALSRFDRVETVGVRYGQRHDVEMTCRRNVLRAMRAMSADWDARLGPDHELDMSLLGQISDCALTRERALELEANGVPNTFVPARNLLFFTFAAALGYRRKIRTLVGGMCETDYSGYADCRDNTLKSLQVTLSLGLDEPFENRVLLIFGLGIEDGLQRIEDFRDRLNELGLTGILSLDGRKDFLCVTHG